MHIAPLRSTHLETVDHLWGNEPVKYEIQCLFVHVGSITQLLTTRRYELDLSTFTGLKNVHAYRRPKEF